MSKQATLTNVELQSNITGLISRNQILLLKAALFPHQDGIFFWREWLSATLNDRIDAHAPNFLETLYDATTDGSETLFSLVYKNLASTNDPAVARLAGIGRHTWTKNQLLGFRMKEVIGALNDAGIDSIIIKGIPVALNYYQDVAVRVVGDGDIMVPFSDKTKALSILLGPKLEGRLLSGEVKMANYAHAAHIVFADKLDIDLHWNVFIEHAGKPNIDSIFWQEKQPSKLNGAPTHILSPTHQFFVSLAHARHYESPAPIRWVTDCFYICKNAEIDWDAIVDLAVQFRYVPFFQEALPILKTEFLLQIPDTCLRRLKDLSPSRAEMNFHRHMKVRGSTSAAGPVRRLLRYPFLHHSRYYAFRKGFEDHSFLPWFLQLVVARSKYFIGK